jgi:hypothetical protein
MVPDSQTDLKFYSNGSRLSNRFDVILMVPESQTDLMFYFNGSRVSNRFDVILMVNIKPV